MHTSSSQTDEEAAEDAGPSKIVEMYIAEEDSDEDEDDNNKGGTGPVKDDKQPDPP
jgi:hypothetical protein